MQSMTQWLSGLSATDPSLWLALGSGLVVILVFLLLGRRGKRFRGPVVLDAAPSASPDWEAPHPLARHDERRRSIRRGGLPTPILVVDSKGGKRAKATEAYVLDRSTGGLRLGPERALPAGSTPPAQAGQGPQGVAWVEVG